MKSYGISFFGKTGYGKSSLVNCLFGTHFSTDPFYSCTKELYAVTTLADAPAGYEAVTVYDTPGIGEFPDDDPYQRYYDYAASQADVIVLVSTFSRADAPEQELLLSLRDSLDPERHPRFVIALNHIDSTKVAMTPDYNPWDDVRNEPSEECRELIRQRERILHEKFDDLFMAPTVVPVCAMRGYGIDHLKKILLHG